MPDPIKAILPVLSVLLALAPLPQAAAATYKWIDESGGTHYGDQPPPGRSAEALKPPSTPATDPAKAERSLKSKLEAFDKRREKQQKQAELAKRKKQQQNAIAENCRKAHEQLHMLSTRNRIQVVQGGTVSTMTMEQRQATTAKLQQYLKKNCAGH